MRLENITQQLILVQILGVVCVISCDVFIYSIFFYFMGDVAGRKHYCQAILPLPSPWGSPTHPARVEDQCQPPGSSASAPAMP